MPPPPRRIVARSAKRGRTLSTEDVRVRTVRLCVCLVRVFRLRVVPTCKHAHKARVVVLVDESIAKSGSF